MGKKAKQVDPNLIIETKHDYVVIDIETTGLKVGEDAITEIGMIKVKKDKIIQTYSTLIHPTKKISREITELTGITNSMVRNAPYMEEVIDEIKAFIGNDPIMGHKVNVDLSFLQLHDAFFNQKYLDTLKYARKAFPYLISCSLSSLVEEFDLIQNEHRALADCFATKALYDFILQKRGAIEKVMKENHYTDPIDLDVIEKIKEGNQFKNEHCVISGYLSNYSKNTANAIIEKLGGKTSDKVDQFTTLLILGEHKKGLLTKKHTKALERIDLNQEIKIITEDEFYNQLK